MTIERFELDTEQWAVEGLRKIADWPDGGNTYGQNNIKKFARKLLAAAPRPEAVRQDGAVTDYGSIDQQSEFIQLFNAAFEALSEGHSIGICFDLMKCAKAELNKLVKQQKEPRPAEPDGGAA